MRIWHQKLIPYLDRQRLLSQHRECCALRGAGWGRPHATVNYVFTHRPEQLVAYHFLVMNEMKRRGYNPDKIWYNPDWRGSTLGEQQSWADPKATGGYIIQATTGESIIYPEHNDAYYQECIQLLKDKNAPIDWSKVPIIS
jgi:uncharacterized protein (TIGR02328 family)